MITFRRNKMALANSTSRKLLRPSCSQTSMRILRGFPQTLLTGWMTKRIQMSSLRHPSSPIKEHITKKKDHPSKKSKWKTPRSMLTLKSLKSDPKLVNHSRYFQARRK